MGLAYCGGIETVCAKCGGNRVVLRVSGGIGSPGGSKVVILGGAQKFVAILAFFLIKHSSPNARLKVWEAAGGQST